MSTATIRIDYQPRPWQLQIHRDPARFRVVACHRRAGKTKAALHELVDCALRTERPLALFGYLAPFRNQARAIAWAELKRILEPLRVVGAVDVHEAELSITFRHNGATVRLFGADNSQALRGLRFDGIVLDEVAHIGSGVWSDIVQPALSDRMGWALFIGTPNGVDLFSELFAKAEGLPDWSRVRFTCYDTGALDPAEVERLRREQPPNTFAREMLADFQASAADQLLSLVDVEAASLRVYSDSVFMTAPKVMGVDPARFGDDSSAIVRRQGLVMWPSILVQGLDNMHLAARVAREIQDWQPDAVFVDSGAGAGVIDRLRQLGYHVVEVPFGGKATLAEQFVNRRTEMWFAAADWVRAGGAIPPSTRLKQQLAAPTYGFDAHGRKALEAKDDLKKKLSGQSPDEADGLALTFAMPVVARTWRDDIPRQRREREDPVEAAYSRSERIDPLTAESRWGR